MKAFLHEKSYYTSLVIVYINGIIRALNLKRKLKNVQREKICDFSSVHCHIFIF